jgi:hypothetical protein
MSNAAVSHRAHVQSLYRTLLRYIARLPSPEQRSKALTEAQTTVRERRGEQDPQARLQHVKELTARIGYLRIVTPRQPGEVSTGVFVYRGGQLVEGSGEGKGTR